MLSSDRQVMKMLSIAVCDDSIIECCSIAKKIKKMMNEIKVPCLVSQFNSGQQLLQASGCFDIIFLDIMMSGLNGMKTAELFRERAYDKILIFMSSSREYVFEAYDVEAFQYLLKPVNEEKLKRVLQKAVLKTEVQSQDFIIVNKERQQKKWYLDDIYYFEIKGRKIDVHGANGAFSYYERIGSLEESLRGKDFFRCHKSYLINLKHVEGYDRREAGLDNGERIIIAKRRYEAFCKEILMYMRKTGGIV